MNILYFLDQGVVRGHTDSVTSPQSLLGHVYSLIRSNKQHRRAFLRALLRHFENYEVNRNMLLEHMCTFVGHQFT